MQKFRMLIDSKQGDQLSNAMGPVEAVLAADHVHLLTGTEPELILDTRTLRRELEPVDAMAERLRKLRAAEQSSQHQDAREKTRGIELAICWNKPIVIEAATSCNCAKCKAARDAVASAKHAGLPVQETTEAAAGGMEHPYFAPPPLKYGMATIEEDEPEAVVSLQSCVFRDVKPQPTILSRICDLVRWFVGVEEGL